ncbi:MAG: xanthine dehydrogenase family protein molybdopterin-binding subunit [Dehalobacterium sp.]
MGEGKLIGQSVPRIDAPRKVMGRAGYTCDLEMSGLLEAGLVKSPYSSARIKHIDISGAVRIPGVKAVITGKDVPGLFGTTVKDRPVLAQEIVRFFGEPVAAVAAESKEILEQALACISVEYEELPGLYSAEKAMEPGSILIHENLGDYEKDVNTYSVQGTNICHHFKLRKGNIDEGLAAADRIFEDTYIAHPNYHACIEPHIAIARMDQDGILNIWSSNQSPYVLQRTISQLFKIPMNRVRITIPTVGGGFGAKIYASIEPVIAALAFKTNGRPVRLNMDRKSDFTNTVINHAVTIKLTTGVKSNGLLVARKVSAYWDTGAYADCGPLVARSGGFTSAGPYRIPHIHIDSYAIYTNNPIAGAFRGYGVPQVTWAYECQMDKIAHELGFDPLQMRLDNIIKDGDINATGEKLTAVGLESCLREVAKNLGWEPGKRPGTEIKEDGRIKSVGIACSWKASQRSYPTSATVRVMEDGSVEVNCSTVDMGQGSATIFAQIVSEEIGVPLKHVQVRHPDTFITPYDRTTSASRSTFHAGTAVRKAAQDAKEQLLELAVKLLECKTSDLLCAEGKIRCTQNNAALTFGEIISKGVIGGVDIIGKGVSILEGGTGLDKETGQGTRPASFWMYTAHGVETVLDPITGKIYVERIVAAHDVGKAINKVNCAQQIEGGVVMGLGIALLEELQMKDGKILNSNLHDYKMPTCADVPDIETILVEEPHPDGPYGAKGLGEPPVAPVAPAIANALAQASGLWMTELPMNHQRVLRALKGGKA